MKTTYTVTEGQAKFPAVVREAEGGAVAAITRHNEVVAYVVSRERMDALAETLEILGNPEAMRTLRSYEAGKLRMTRAKLSGAGDDL